MPNASPIPVTAGSGIDLDGVGVTVAGQPVVREVMVMADPNTAGSYATVTPAGAVQVDGSAVTQPVTSPTSSTANSPAATGVSGSSGQILATNAVRKELIITNTGTVTVYLALGQTPTSSAYHIALAPCGSANDGTGGVYVSDIWKGAINAITAGSAGTVCVTELT